MSIVQKSDFVDEVEIANWAQPATAASLNRFIAKYESKFLSYLMKPDFKNEFYTELAKPEILSIWQALSDYIKPAIVNYIYVKYQYWLDTQTTGNGEGKLQSANAVNVSARGKVVKQWNEMVDTVQRVNIVLNEQTFPNYAPVYSYWFYEPGDKEFHVARNAPEIYIKINSFSL